MKKEAHQNLEYEEKMKEVTINVYKDGKIVTWGHGIQTENNVQEIAKRMCHRVHGDRYEIVEFSDEEREP